MRADPSTAPDSTVRAEIERILERNVGAPVPEAELLILLRNIPAYQRATQRLHQLPLPQEEAPTPPSGEPQR